MRERKRGRPGNRERRKHHERRRSPAVKSDRKTRSASPKIRQLSGGRKDQERRAGNAAEKPARKWGLTGRRKDQATDQPETRVRAGKTIERVPPFSVSKKTVERNRGGAEKDHRRGTRSDMVRVAKKIRGKCERAALNHARFGAEAVFSVRSRRRAAGALEAGRDRRR